MSLNVVLLIMVIILVVVKILIDIRNANLYKAYLRQNHDYYKTLKTIEHRIIHGPHEDTVKDIHLIIIGALKDEKAPHKGD